MAQNEQEFSSALDAFITQAMSRYQVELEEAIRIRSESADPTYKQNLAEILDFMKVKFSEMGVHNVEVVPNHGFPVLVATIPGTEDAPNVLVYNHMDVQPVKPENWTDLEKWGMNDPFDAKTKDGIVKGRGSTDDKGPAGCIREAIRFLKEHDYAMPNIQIIYETEEESGSTKFPTFISENSQLLKPADVLLVSDTTFESETLPAVTVSLRGLVNGTITIKESKATNPGSVEVLNYSGGIEEQNKFGTIIPPEASVRVRVHSSSVDSFAKHVKSINEAIEVTQNKETLELKLKTGTAGVHSGIFGGVAINPLSVLAYSVGSYVQINSDQSDSQNALTKLSVLVARSYDAKTGKVTIPHFNDRVPELSEAELENITELASLADFNESIAANGIEQVYTTNGVEQRIRAWMEPTFDVHGFSQYEIDGEQYTHIKVSMRLAGEQDPNEIINYVNDVAKKVDPNVDVQLKGTGLFTANADNKYVSAAAEEYQHAFGVKAVLNRSGGSIPTMGILQEVFPGMPIVLAGLSLLSDGYHKPNEQFQLTQAKKGIETMARIFHRYAKME